MPARVCNWVQHFSPERLASELSQAGLECASVLGDVAGRPFDRQSSEFAAIARRQQALVGAACPESVAWRARKASGAQ
jgi:hypothetical protein